MAYQAETDHVIANNTARAQLLAGLRTGPRQQRQGSPGLMQQQQVESPAALRHLTANAPAFVPGGSGNNAATGTPPEFYSANADYMGSLENQLAALQMSAMHSTPNIAASYGATQGQPQHRQQKQQPQHRYPQHHHQQYTDDQINQEAVAQFMRQRQAQQQYEQQQQQQRAVFAHVQAEYERQAKMAAAMHQQHQQPRNASGTFGSAHEQRQAAQASIQANLRNRQVQQLYAELLQEEEQGRLDSRVLDGRDLWQVAVDAVNEQHDEHLQQQQQQQQQSLSHASQEELRQLQLQQYSLQIQQLQEQARQAIEAQRRAAEFEQQQLQQLQQMQQQQQRMPQQHQPRERVASHADKANNWRSRADTSGPQTPDEREVVRESASTSSTASPRSSRSFNSAGAGAAAEEDSPRTSEEDVGDAGATTMDNMKKRENERFGKDIGRGPPPPSAVLPLKTTSGPRAFSLAAAPRSRSDAAAKQATRQPRGPPTEFEAVNFAARKNVRVRKEALSKLRACSSPRMVTSPVIA